MCPVSDCEEAGCEPLPGLFRANIGCDFATVTCEAEKSPRVPIAPRSLRVPLAWRTLALECRLAGNRINR
jgi:hypothetical protein